MIKGSFQGSYKYILNPGKEIAVLISNIFFFKKINVFQTDSDGQTNPDEFPAFWENRRNQDVSEYRMQMHHFG